MGAEVGAGHGTGSRRYREDRRARDTAGEEEATRHGVPGAGVNGRVYGPPPPPLHANGAGAAAALQAPRARPVTRLVAGGARPPLSASLESFLHPEPLEGGGGE